MTESEVMTEIEAIEVIEKNRPTSGYVMLNEALDVAIKAIRKQIPKKPKTDDRYVMYICPCCNDFIKVIQNYCPNCGQRIDFGE